MSVNFAIKIVDKFPKNDENTTIFALRSRHKGTIFLKNRHFLTKSYH